MDPVVQSSTAEIVQYGVLGVACIIFAWVIAFLYKRNEARVEKGEEAAKKMGEERASWQMREQQLRSEAAQREQALRAENAMREIALRSELAEKQRQEADAYAKELRELRTASQAREDAIRREYDELMEKVSVEATKQASAVANVLDKFYDRITLPRVHRS